MDKFYKILGVSPLDSDEVIEQRYTELKNKYLEERFLEGEAGNNAAKMLTEVENAYLEIKSYRSQTGSNTSGENLFSEISTLIKSGDIRLAQEKLDSFDERGAEWHYYQSVVFYKKNWINESKKQLEIALQIEPDNTKYKLALQKIVEKVNSTQSANPNWNRTSGPQGNPNPNYNGQNSSYTGGEPQLGGDSCMQWCCDMIMCNMLLNCCCNCN